MNNKLQFTPQQKHKRWRYQSIKINANHYAAILYDYVRPLKLKPKTNDVTGIHALHRPLFLPALEGGISIAGGHDKPQSH